MSEYIQAIYQAILDGENIEAPQKVQAALDAGVDPAQILSEGMVKAMDEVGHLFESGYYYVPEMLIAARAMQAGLALLKPHLVSAHVQPMGKVIIGTVKGDLHDIGKNLVAMMLEGAAFEIVDLGTDVQPDEFVEAIRKYPEAKLVAMSALLTTTMPAIQTTLEALKAAGVRDQVKVMIGGAPLTQAYADEIGADGYSPDASRAVSLARLLVA